MKKIIAFILCFVIAAALPFVAVPCVLAATGAQYSETYYAALAKQYDRLCAVNEPKVVVVGGSSVAFGLDSELFGKLYGKPSVAFGLYGSFGVKVMIDLSKANLRSGDTVVIAPEISPESLSLYFGAESMLKATEERFDLLSHTAFDNIGDIMGASWGFALTKLQNLRSGEEFDISGVYSNSSVNSYGEIGRDLFPRNGNVLATGYLSDRVRFDIGDVSDEFIDYVNDYVGYCRARGVRVYYSFAPVNGRAADSKTLRADTEEYYGYLSRKLDCEVISDPYAYVLDYRYFYDTNFHLNDSGAALRTAMLVRDLKRAEGDTSAVDFELPAPPDPVYVQREIDTTLPYTDSGLFEYTETEGGYLAISGIKDEARLLKNIVLPVVHDNKYVVSVLSGAFKGCTELEEVTVPVGIGQIDNAVFDGCSSLARIRVLEKSQDNIAVSDGLMIGVPKTCRIVIVNATVSDFGTGYFWSRYAEYLVKGD